MARGSKLDFKKDPGIEAMLRRSLEVEKALRLRAEAAASVAREIAPVDSGAYRDGIQAQSGIRGNVATARVNARDWKSHFIEFGTSQRAARAILRRACDAVGLKLVRGGDE